jgi:AraC-like DNA-binding protein
MEQNENFRRPITGIFPIVLFAVDQGIDASALFKGTGLNENDLLDSKNEIFLWQELSIIRNLDACKASPETAWELGRYFNTRTHGALGNMIAKAPTVGDVISCIIDYSVLSHSYFRLYPESIGNRFRVTLAENYLPDDLLPFLVERDLIAGITIMEARLPGKKPDIILSISFSHSPRTHISKYQSVFIENINFNQPTTFFEIDKASLNLPIPNGNSQEFELFRQQCQAEYSLREKNRFLLSDRVRLCLQKGKGKVTLMDVARMLHMSERSLRRKLRREGVNFRKIKNQFNFQQSVHLLRDPNLRIEEISDLIGYSETCTFTRSFQKWTGMSPRMYRKKKM